MLTITYTPPMGLLILDTTPPFTCCGDIKECLMFGEYELHAQKIQPATAPDRQQFTYCIVRDSSAVRRLFVRLAEPWDVRALSIRKTAGLPLQLWVGTFPRFVAIRFYFLSETLI